MRGVFVSARITTISIHRLHSSSLFTLWLDLTGLGRTPEQHLDPTDQADSTARFHYIPYLAFSTGVQLLPSTSTTIAVSLSLFSSSSFLVSARFSFYILTLPRVNMTFYSQNYNESHHGFFQARFSTQEFETINELAQSTSHLEPGSPSAASVSPLSAHEDLSNVLEGPWANPDYFFDLDYPDHDVDVSNDDTPWQGETDMAAQIDPAMNLSPSLLGPPPTDGRLRSDSHTSTQSFYTARGVYTPELVVSTDVSPLLFGTTAYPGQDATEVISNFDMNDTQGHVNLESVDNEETMDPSRATLRVPFGFGSRVLSDHGAEPCPTLSSVYSSTNFGCLASQDGSQSDFCGVAFPQPSTPTMDASDISDQDISAINGQFQDQQMISPTRTCSNLSNVRAIRRNRRLSQRKEKQPCQCPDCNGWFASKFEMSRHQKTQHQDLVVKFFCQDPTVDGICGDMKIITPLSSCPNCVKRKLYRAPSGAADHMRRIHFSEPPDREDKNRPSRGGRGGGPNPPLSAFRNGGWLNSSVYRKSVSHAPSRNFDLDRASPLHSTAALSEVDD